MAREATGRPPAWGTQPRDHNLFSSLSSGPPCFWMLEVTQSTKLAHAAKSLQTGLVPAAAPRTEPTLLLGCCIEVSGGAMAICSKFWPFSCLQVFFFGGRNSVFKSYFYYKSHNCEWYFCFAIVRMYIYSLLSTIQYNSVYCLFSKNSLDQETCYLKHMLKFSNGINTWQTVGQHCCSLIASSPQQCENHRLFVIISAFKQIIRRHQLWRGRNGNKQLWIFMLSNNIST